MNSEFTKFTSLMKSIFLSYVVPMHKQSHLFRYSAEKWIFSLKWFRKVQICSSFPHETKISSVSWTYARHMQRSDTYLEINVYCYAFLNLETCEAYATMFSQIFLILKDVAHSSIWFPHIHGGEQGLHTVMIDMCNKQAEGMLCTC